MKDKTNCLLITNSQGCLLSFAMVESVISGAKKSRPVCKQIFAVVTVLCALGGVMYITGLGKQIHEAIDKMITPHQKPLIQRRRYDITSFQTWVSVKKIFWLL